MYVCVCRSVNHFSCFFLNKVNTVETVGNSIVIFAIFVFNKSINQAIIKTIKIFKLCFNKHISNTFDD